VAIGAQGSDIFRLVLREGIDLIFAGLAIGFAADFWGTRGTSVLLAGVSAKDPPTLLGVSLLLTSWQYWRVCSQRGVPWRWSLPCR
jgi:hypothetical protein